MLCPDPIWISSLFTFVAAPCPSFTLQARIERFWGQLNVVVNLPMKLMLLKMEGAGILDMNDHEDIGAIQVLGRIVLQHACDMLRNVWNSVSKSLPHLSPVCAMHP